MFITSPLLESPTIQHGFFTREGGVSEGIYEGLNCGSGSDDNSHHVAKNCQRAAAAFGVDGRDLCTLYQVHSSTALEVTPNWPLTHAPQADAMVTNVCGKMLGILTADCAPLLFADAHNGVIGAAHAGWKGAMGGVIQNTVSAMVKLGAEKQHIRATIGPCIAQTSYEVDAGFRVTFLEQDESNATFFIPSSTAPAKHHFNLTAFAHQQCTLAGLTHVDALDIDTYKEEARFYSNRRRNHAGEPDYGRQLSAIMLK